MASDIIAIDGPSASGKSTVARGVAKELGYIYVDSGSLYRAVTWQAIQDGISADDSARAIEWVKPLAPEFRIEDDAMRFKIHGEDTIEALRSPEVRENVSHFAAIPEVRARIVEWLRALPALGDLVVEGRDIGSVVFPVARLKFYLTADPEERARRRQHDLLVQKEDAAVSKVLDSLKRRDEIDSTRKVAPLAVADDAITIDSTGMEAVGVIAMIVAKCRA